MAAPMCEIEAAVPALRRYARALAFNLDEADDLVQDTLARAIGRRHLWRPTGTVRAWLFTILHNLHVNRIRRDGRRPDRVDLDAIAPPSIASPQVDQIYAGEVARALTLLPDDQRRTLVLVALEEMTYREVADITGVPIGTVMSRLSRARAALKAALDRPSGPQLRRVK